MPFAPFPSPGGSAPPGEGLPTRSGREAGLSRTAIEALVDTIEERAAQLDPDDDETKKMLRYRGIALVDLMQITDIGEEKREQAMSDLERALEADPTDDEVELTISRWYQLEALRHAVDRDSELAEADEATHRELLARTLENHPDSVLARAQNLAVAFGAYAERINAEGGTMRGAGDALKPVALDLLGAVERRLDDRTQPRTWHNL